MCCFCAFNIFFLREASFENLRTDEQIMLASQTRNLIQFEVFRKDSEGHLFARRIVLEMFWRIDCPFIIDIDGTTILTVELLSVPYLQYPEKQLKDYTAKTSRQNSTNVSLHGRS